MSIRFSFFYCGVLVNLLPILTVKHTRKCNCIPFRVLYKSHKFKFKFKTFPFISFVQDMQCLVRTTSVSVSSVQTCETWNYVETSSPLVYSKFYSSDSNSHYSLAN